MNLPEEFSFNRLLLLYKGDISALTLFAQHENGSVCLPEPLPPLSSIYEEDTQPERKVNLHPAVLLQTLNRLLNFDAELLRNESGFCQYVDTPKGVISVYMARFDLLDPPHKLMQAAGFRLKTLPELRGRPPTEMELLRRAYVKVMES